MFRQKKLINTLLGTLPFFCFLLCSKSVFSQSVFPDKLGKIQMEVCGNLLSNTNYVQEKFELPSEKKINLRKTDSVLVTYSTFSSTASNKFFFGKNSFKRTLRFMFSNNKLFEQQLQIIYSPSQYKLMLSDYKLLILKATPLYKYFFNSTSTLSSGEINGKGVFFANIKSIDDYKESARIYYEVNYESVYNFLEKKYEDSKVIEGYSLWVIQEDYSIANFKRF